MESSAGHDFPTYIWDEAYFNAMFSGVSLQSFLAAGNNYQTHPLSPSLFGGGYISDALTYSDSITTPFYPPLPILDSSDAAFFKVPKPEPMDVYDQVETEESAFGVHDSTSFPHLPDLRSWEQCSSASALNKRARVEYVLNPPLQMVEPLMVRGCDVFQNIPVPYGQYQPSPDLTGSAAVTTTTTTKATPPPTVQIPRSALARERRQKLSDKTRCLQKLLPWDKKMDIATMLEEAYKYVKFLQAQLLALQSMPSESAISTHSTHRYNTSSVYGGLERLNRNQLLQVLVNSPVAQTLLCSQSCCVFSAEQLGIIPKVAEKRVMAQQMMSTFRHKP